MDAQTVSQINQIMERSQREVAANAQVVGYITIIMAIFAAVWITWLFVSAWRREQHARAERRVLDRLAQQEDPEGWARRQARQAQVAALVAAELAAVRRTRWYARLLGWG
jgi:hypothetical protein